jgi:hypothetical protein
LSASRSSTAERLGRVRRRGGAGGAAARSRRSSAARNASARFRCCDREELREAVITGPTAAVIRSIISLDSPLLATSIRTVTALSEVLAC